MSRLQQAVRMTDVVMIERHQRVLRIVALAVVGFFSAVVLLFARRSSELSGVALGMLVVAVVVGAIRPRISMYVIVFFTLVGDTKTAAWFPFTKNLSSQESLLYIADPLTVSPLEVLVGTTFVFWLIDSRFGHKRAFTFNPLVRATAVFTAFVVAGFVYGIGTGGDKRVALFEGRSMFLVLPVFMMIAHLFDATGLRRLLGTAMLAIVINALLGLQYLGQLSPQDADLLEALGEHPASVHMNVLFLLTLTCSLYRAGPRSARLVLVAACVPVSLAYFAAQRRGAFVAFGGAIALVVLSLLWRRRRAFFIIAPTVLVLTAGYTAAFWNTTSGAGFPAQAIKTVIAPGDVSEEDRSSNVYRNIENFDINFTIRQSPLLGLGFGQAFYTPFPLPDISFFEFYRYIPHNSILWVWIKMGFLGFFSMFVMLGVAVREGTRRVIGETEPLRAVSAMMGVSYVVMFAIFAFVDISWDPRSMVYLALSFALCVGSRSMPASDGAASDAHENTLAPVVQELVDA